jgi:(aminoalkyl)phosphonate N-acetyltransferase
MTIRQANMEDSERIFKFICELEETDFDYSIFEKYYKANLTNEDNIYLVAVNNNNMVIGYLSCHGQLILHHLSKVFEIQELFVEKEYRNQQIGQRLIEQLEDILKKKNHSFLEVATNIKRLNTHKFYNKCGFTQSHYKFTKTLK